MPSKSSCLKRLTILEEKSDFKEVVHVTSCDNFGLDVHSDIPVSYRQEGSLKGLHSDKSMVKIIVGPFGSGKSSACCAEIIHMARNMPKMLDGVRRSRIALIRNTMGELESTTLLTWTQWFGRLGNVKRTKKPLLTLRHEFNDEKGKIELELIFIGLDREDDKEKLESMELTAAYINEMQHIPKAIFTHLLGRIGRFPKKDCLEDDYYACVIADTNPPDMDHWIYKDFEEKSTPNIRVFHQPPGLIRDQNGDWIDNPCADNINNLKPKYYSNMAQLSNYNEEYIKVYCLGEYGIVIPGKKVFPEYNDELHSDATVDILEDEDILIAWDYGLTPCCLIMQLSKRGQLRVFKEFVTERSGVRQLARTIVIPYLKREFEGMTIHSIGDPSGTTASQTDELSCCDILSEEGLDTEKAKTNDLEPRLESVRFFLNTLIEGQAALLISREGCPTLRKSFLGQYCYKRVRVVGDEKYKETPDKSHPWSDVMDCLQYGACEFSGEGIRFKKRSNVDYSQFMNTERF